VKLVTIKRNGWTLSSGITGQFVRNMQILYKINKLGTSWPIILAFIVCTSLVACASVPMADPRQDTELKKFTIDPDEAGLYIYRDEFMAAAYRMSVQVDGVPLGQTAVRTYLYTQIAPGKHIITSSLLTDTDTLDVEINAGSICYVRQEIRVGFISSSAKLHLMNEAEGEKGVLSCKLAERTPIVQAIEVRVEADAPALTGPLKCQASNSFGTWPFDAPGTVTVRSSTTSLLITCKAPVGTANDIVTSAPSAHESSKANPAEVMTRGGAIVGSAVGIVLGIAATPVMGPEFGVALGVGAAMKGVELGELGSLGFAAVVAASSGNQMVYPNTIVLHVKRLSPPIDD